MYGEWWHNAVIYHIYPRSFADADGDGVGDLAGIASRLDYLAWLGVDAIWCGAVAASSNHDFGYDVTDYRAIEPSLGTMADFDRLVAEAGRRGIRVLVDLVPNHTSVEHPWFTDPSTKRSYYVWSDRPNNWTSSLHLPAWSRDPEEDSYYLHSYLPQQPDLDWWNEKVRAEFDDIVQFWFDRGVAGFRIDACYVLLKDRLLRDNPAARAGDHMWDLNRGQRPVHSAHQPEIHEVLRRWRAIAQRYDPPRLLIGATWVPEPADLAKYYGDGDELQLPQYFQLVFSKFAPDALSTCVQAWIDAGGPHGTALWVGSNHDLSRFPTRWCDGDERLTRLALAMLMTLPGACVLFQGDEFGMEDVVVPPESNRDAAPWPRDASRTPIPWTPGPLGGFTTGTPWLPLGDTARNVEDQRADPDSVLNETRRLIRLKKRLAGPYRALPAESGHWRYRRGAVTIDLDFERAAVSIDG
jgi:alpha-glucosidase